MAYDFDLLTIGAGSGGVAGTRRAGSYGARTGIIESLRVGGTCVLRGCVPKKLLVYGVHFAEEFAPASRASEGLRPGSAETSSAPHEHPCGALSS